jgi:hypothetical protein
MAAEDTKLNKLSVREFMSWLSGVEEMQDEGWTPTGTQWKRIRDKINLIDDTPAPTSRVVAPSQPDSGRPTTFGPTAPPVYTPSNMVANPAADLAGKPFLPEQPGQPARTPSIDTSSGIYGSPFA